jgi:hypothetical protein
MSAVAYIVPRAPTVGEAERGFRDAVADRYETLRCFIDQDVLGLEAIAEVLAKACREIETLYRGLDTARLYTDCDGRCAPETFVAAKVDTYAFIEGLLWGKLSDGAELLLKTQLQAALQAGQKQTDAPSSRNRITDLTPSFDEGCMQ